MSVARGQLESCPTISKTKVAYQIYKQQADFCKWLTHFDDILVQKLMTYFSSSRFCLIQIAKFGDIFSCTEPRIFSLTFWRRSPKTWLHHCHKVLICYRNYFCPVLDINRSFGFRNNFGCHLNNYSQAHPTTCKILATISHTTNASQ